MPHPTLILPSMVSTTPFRPHGSFLRRSSSGPMLHPTFILPSMASTTPFRHCGTVLRRPSKNTVIGSYGACDFGQCAFNRYLRVSPSPGVPSCLPPTALAQLTTMLERSLTDILRDPTTIHFVPGTDDADLGDILVKNPQRTPDGFVWLSPDRKTETVITLVGKVVYGAIGDKTGPYFSLPDKLFVRTLLTFTIVSCHSVLPGRRHYPCRDGKSQDRVCRSSHQ